MYKECNIHYQDKEISDYHFKTQQLEIDGKEVLLGIKLVYSLDMDTVDG